MKTKKENNETKVLSGPEILGHLKAEIITVPIPEWGAGVRCANPAPETFFESEKLKAVDPKAAADLLFKACLIDITPAELDAIERADGAKYLQLFAALTRHLSFFKVVQEKQQKN
ncbi:MAG: hypothetical protein AB1403_22065 [Candidatus Riflebacteria bacterium]